MLITVYYHLFGIKYNKYARKEAERMNEFLSKNTNLDNISL